MRIWTPLLLAAALAGQSAPVSKSPDTRLNEARAAVIQARLELDALTRRRDEAASTDELRRLEAEAALRAARDEAAAAEVDAERAALARAAALNAARQSAAGIAAAVDRAALEADVKITQLEAAVAAARLDGDLALHRANQRLASVAPAAQVAYPLDPVVDGTLRISDRRIPFNGRVDAALADLVIGQIAFFNAQDATQPIFIVIDSSPGGSVMSGYLILRAMEASKAPVYVVVKGAAASMAAVITTLAKRSFCYPGTLFMHHQPSSVFQGNLTILRERLDWTRIWCDRINADVAARMGISLEEFVRRMYAASVTGDWRVTGTEARELRWVTDVVERMAEDGVVRLPEPAAPARPLIVIRGEDGAEAEAPVLPGDILLIHEPAQPSR
jgi:ATP-dependent Clp protease, protease subunit